MGAKDVTCMAARISTAFSLKKSPSNLPILLGIIMEYGSTVVYIVMAPKKWLYAYKVICSKLCPTFSHKLLWTIPVILECFHH